MIDPTLKAYIQQKIIPIYLQFDASHSPDHVQQVIHNSFEIAANLEVDLDMVYTVAAYHDIGLSGGRKNHETKSKEIVLSDAFLCRYFSNSQLQMIGEAVEDHRASLPTEPRSIYGKIIAEADRDLDFQRILTRTLTYAIAVKGLENTDELRQEAYQYIANKYVTKRQFQLWLTYPKNSAGLAEIARQIHDPQAFEASFWRSYQQIKKSDPLSCPIKEQDKGSLA
ncbi:HD domain-containing protein [Enterococcus sp.]|uniref:HD domain-containing protein n=1 Tax=Enterococcus sp. TaxID=35783 RepID=UPI0028966203|nr:HD domain-containing protein [Enterococcus sp.]